MGGVGDCLLPMFCGYICLINDLLVDSPCSFSIPSRLAYVTFLSSISDGGFVPLVIFSSSLSFISFLAVALHEIVLLCVTD